MKQNNRKSNVACNRPSSCQPLNLMEPPLDNLGKSLDREGNSNSTHLRFKRPAAEVILKVCAVFSNPCRINSNFRITIW